MIGILLDSTNLSWGMWDVGADYALPLATSIRQNRGLDRLKDLKGRAWPA